MTTLITNSQFKQFDENGKPLAAGKIYTYEVGTTTDKVTYEDQEKTSAHTNPIILDSWGEATIWIDGDTKFVVTDSNDVAVRTYPIFADTQVTSTETPVISSPLDAVYRSTSTDTGYIKIRLPIGGWPNTKMMFDVMIYEDTADKAFTLTLGGYANSNTTAWETTTAITNGADDIAVQFGHDGTYPAVYIGGVASEWDKPQIAVTNFLAGEFNFDHAAWDDGWDISVTVTLGTITSSETATSDAAAIAVVASDLSTSILEQTGDWVSVTFTTSWVAVTGNNLPPTVQYRTIMSGASIQIRGVCERTGGDNTVFTLPAALFPAYSLRAVMIDVGGTPGSKLYIDTDGEVDISVAGIGEDVSFNHIIPIT